MVGFGSYERPRPVPGIDHIRVHKQQMRGQRNHGAQLGSQLRNYDKSQNNCNDKKDTRHKNNGHLDAVPNCSRLPYKSQVHSLEPVDKIGPGKVQAGFR